MARWLIWLKRATIFLAWHPQIVKQGNREKMYSYRWAILRIKYFLSFLCNKCVFSIKKFRFHIYTLINIYILINVLTAAICDNIAWTSPELIEITRVITDNVTWRSYVTSSFLYVCNGILWIYPCFYIMTRCDWHNSAQRDSDIRPFFSCSVTFGNIERDKEIHPFFLLIIYFISHYYLFRIMKLLEVELFLRFLLCFLRKISTK